MIRGQTMNELQIHRLARANDLAGLRDSIDRGVDLDEVDEFQTTALQYAIAEGNREGAAMLLQHGAGPANQDSDGSTALHYVAEKKWLEIAELILKARPSTIDLVDKHGNQPLWTASFAAHGQY